MAHRPGDQGTCRAVAWPHHPCEDGLGRRPIRGKRSPQRWCNDPGVEATPTAPAWSRDVGRADWIGERLTPQKLRSPLTVTSVVPAGFEAYTRILHPAQEPGHGHRLLRWREISAWSGVPLSADAQFHTIALPPERPAGPAPWRGQGPHEGRLYLPDAEALAQVLRGFTTTPEECFFGLWDGYGFSGVSLTSPGSPPAMPLPDPVPVEVRQGPLVRLPDREYLLYTGPVEAITATAEIGHGQTANLAWPADRAWCVASELDLTCTYVGGSVALVERILADERLEALPADADDPLTHVEPSIAELVERAVDELLNSGHAVVTTSMGDVEAWLERPTRWRAGALRVRAERDDRSRGGSGGPVHYQQDLRREAVFRLTDAVIGLVGG